MADVVGKTTAPSAERGAGLGASHQTGWTALGAVLAQVFSTVDARTVLESDRNGFIAAHGSVGRP